jgi:hypothetical protein
MICKRSRDLFLPSRGSAAVLSASDLGYTNFWLGDLDSNQDSQIQSLESYQLDDLPVVANTGLTSCHGLKFWVKRVNHSNF